MSFVFEVDASVIKSLMASTYMAITKANCQVLTQQYDFLAHGTDLTQIKIF